MDENVKKLMVKNSGQVEVISATGKVYLYTHTGARELVQHVHTALSLKENWKDADYLARMLFCEMTRGQEMSGSKGYGIGPEFYISAELTVTVDCERRQVLLAMQGHLHDKRVFTFEEFVSEFERGAAL
jgi:hypothetical protein